MSKGGRATAAAIAVGLTAQLAMAGLVLADRLRPHHRNVDVLKVRDVPILPVPTVTAEPTVSPLPSPKVTVPSLPSVPTPSVSLPVPIPTVSLPPLPHVQLPKCGDVLLSDAPTAADDFQVPPSGEDTASLHVADGAAYFPETRRDGGFSTTIARVDLASGQESHSAADPFFSLTDVGSGYAWGTDRDGVVRLDPSDSSAEPKRWGRDDFVVDGSSGEQQVSPQLVAADGPDIYVLGSQGTALALSRLDADSGTVAWTVELPESDTTDSGIAIGSRTILGAYGGSAYVAIPMRADSRGVVRVWRVTTGGKIAAQQDITAPGADPSTESLLSVTADGVFASVPTGNAGNAMDATVFKLDPQSLAPEGHVDIPVLEDLNAFGGVMWAVTIQCNEFIWYRYDAGDLHQIGRPWILPNMSYTVDGTSGEVWSLRTRNPMEATAVVGYHF